MYKFVPFYDSFESRVRITGYFSNLHHIQSPDNPVSEFTYLANGHM